MQTLPLIGVVSSLALLCACAGSDSAVKRNTAMIPANQHFPTCSRELEVRFSSNGENCTIYGRSYSNEDLRRTGATTTAAALQQLDPAITAR